MMREQQIRQWVSSHQDEILRFNRELVAIPSINLCGDGGEAAVQAYIQAALERLGCEVDVFLPTEVAGIEEHPAYMRGRQYVNRPNVVGIKKGEEELLTDFTQLYEAYAAQEPDLSRAEYEIQVLIRFLPGSSIPEGHPGLTVIEQVYEAVIGDAPLVQAAPLACDAFMFNRLSDTPAIIWGPKGGNAHAPNGYIEIDSFLLLVQCYAALMMEWCGVDAGIGDQ